MIKDNYSTDQILAAERLLEIINPSIDLAHKQVVQFREALLSEERLRREAVFDARRVREAWADYLAGQPLYPKIWAVLMFQAWWERRGSGTVRQ